MFSDHLQPVHPFPLKAAAITAGGLVIACQLIAMVLVVDSQVEKAQSRQTSQTNFQSAVATCVESSYGVALNKCASLASSAIGLSGPALPAVVPDVDLRQ